MDTPILGQVKTVLIIDGKGTITSIHTQTKENRSTERIKIIGDTKIDTAVLDHVNTTILSLVDKLVTPSGLKPQNYEITIKNIDAASVHDLGLEISGHSLDVSIFLSMLSAGLRLPISQEAVFTGGIDTPDGYLAPVSGLPEKIKAAAEDRKTQHFVHSSFEQDGSTKNLTPNEYKRVSEALLNYKEFLKFSAVNNIFEVIKMAISENNICLASLKSGFYSGEKLSITDLSPVGQTLLYIYNDNDRKFWKTIERHLLKADIDEAREYIKLFIRHFIDNTVYPKNFGEQLLQLILSLPPVIKRKTGFYPLLEMKDYIKITHLAQESDYDDIKKLFRAAYGDTIQLLKTAKTTDAGQQASAPKSSTLLEQFLRELSSENIAREVLLPIDTARASYIIDKVTVGSYEEFLETITAFYAHILRHLGQLSGDADQKQVTSHALDLAKRAFYRNGEEKGAYNEAKTGVNGGLRYIFDQMTNRLKTDERSKYVKMILHTLIDPMDFDAKTVLIKTIMSQLGPVLPEEIRTQPPARFAADYDKIIEAYSQSQEKLLEYIKTL